MNQEQFETMKELIADVENAAIIYGRAAERYDLNEEYSRYPLLEKYKQSKFVAWGEKSEALHNFMEKLKESQ